MKTESPRHFQAVKNPKGRGGEGGKENALLPVAGISKFKLYRRVGKKCTSHLTGGDYSSVTLCLLAESQTDS